MRNINVMEILNCLHSQLTHSTTHSYPTRNATRGVFNSPQVQNKFTEMYSIIQSHECMELPSISYSTSEQQTWFQNTNKATPHGTTNRLQYSTQQTGCSLSQYHPFCHQSPIYYPPLRPVCSRLLALASHSLPDPYRSSICLC